jgi:hypothetical protein
MKIIQEQDYKADKYLQFKNNSLEELKTIFKRVMQYLNNVDYTSNTSTRTINGLDDLSKDGLNTVGASEIARDNDTVSRRGSFIDGTCLSHPGCNKYWHRNAAPQAHPGRREMGTSPTPFPICTGPTQR